jgi:hypothetical protein
MNKLSRLASVLALAALTSHTGAQAQAVNDNWMDASASWSG